MGLNTATAAAAELTAFADDVGNADELHHDVAAAPAGKPHDFPDAAAFVIERIQVDRRVRAEAPCEVEPVGLSVDHDHALRPGVTRDRRCI